MSRLSCCFLFVLLHSCALLYGQCAPDTIPPNAICYGQTVSVCLNNSGVAWVYGTQLDSNSIDNCGISSLTINGNDSVFLNCAALGTTTPVVLAVRDSSNNMSTCSAAVTIIDTILPHASCQNITVPLNANGLATVTADDINFYSSDNCSIIDKKINGQDSLVFTCDSLLLAPHVVTLMVTDVYGLQNTCQATINLTENVAPVAQCAAGVTVVLDSTGNASLQASLLDNGSTDNCSQLTYTVNGNPNWSCSCANVGITNSLVLTVTDASNNMANCMTQVQVLDQHPPTVICKNVVIYINGNGNASVSADDFDDGSYDNCQVSSKAFSDGSYIKNFTCADTGAHTITMVVTDPSGNQDSCVATVTVRDTIAPIVFCNSFTVDLTSIYNHTLTDADVGALYYDNCTTNTAFFTPAVLDCSHIGQTPYTLTVQDPSGNTTVCSDTVSVLAGLPQITVPSTNSFLLCVGDTLYLDGILPSNGLTYNVQWVGPSGQVSFGPTNAVKPNLSTADEGWYYFEITPSGGQGCTVRDSFYLDVDTCIMSSTSNKQSEEIFIYPNPVRDLLTIEAIGALIENIQLVNSTGKEMSAPLVQQGSRWQLNLEAYTRGVYWLHIKTTTQSYTKLLLSQ